WNGTPASEPIRHTETNYFPTYCAAFSPDGARIVTGVAKSVYRAGNWEGEGRVNVWDARTGTRQLQMKGLKLGAFGVAFSPDGSRIVTKCMDWFENPKMAEVIVWDARTGQRKLELKGFTFPVLDVAFSPDGTRIVTGGGDGRPSYPAGELAGELKVWD